MIYYQANMQHTERTLEALSHTQYDLFCANNRITRTILSVVFIAAGILNLSQWWGILLAAYGCYLTTSTYSSANHTARKLAENIKKSGMPFPASRYEFRENRMDIYSMPKNYKESSLAYSDICRLGEDREYFYLFRDQFGGYMVPKAELKNNVEAFRKFLEEKTRKNFRMRAIPIVRLYKFLRRSSIRP